MKKSCFRCIALDVNYWRARCKLSYAMKNCVPLEECPKPQSRSRSNIPQEYWGILGVGPSPEELQEKLAKFAGGANEQKTSR